MDDAIKAYKENHNLVLDSRSIIVRFRRQKGQIDLPGESKPQQPAKVNVSVQYACACNHNFRTCSVVACNSLQCT